MAWDENFRCILTRVILMVTRAGIFLTLDQSKELWK